MTSARKAQRKQKKRNRAQAKARLSQSKRQEVSQDELHAIIDRAKSVLSAEDSAKLTDAVDTLAFVTEQLDTKGATIRRLRKMLFGASTEKTKDVLGDSRKKNTSPDDATASAGGEATASNAADSQGSQNSAEAASAGTDGVEGKEKPRGHGRNPAAAYTGAKQVSVHHGSLKAKQSCPGCQRGKLYPVKRPKRLVRVTGMAPLQATVYELEQLRCNLCGEVFSAAAPPGVGQGRYDETAASMIALLKYGSGLPFHRIERLESGLGIPLPSSTQWEVVERSAARVGPAYTELIRQAAQGKVLYNDDTTMKVLELGAPERWEELDVNDEFVNRTGVFTTGIVATDDERQVVLFFTGQKHAGENLSTVLTERNAELSPPVQMCDGLSRNIAKDFETLLANCNSHARRRFVDIESSFPDEVRHVLEALRDVYRNDARAKKERLSDDERLLLHQAESRPLLDDLESWCNEQLDERKVEPNSSLGEAIEYMTDHWDELTLFLREPGAPLDNNLCERVLKKAILHRKNSMFYKTLNGARVGDIFMSLIFTAELAKVDVFDYLVALQRHHEHVAASPASWMPWNYAATRAGRPSGNVMHAE